MSPQIVTPAKADHPRVGWPMFQMLKDIRNSSLTGSQKAVCYAFATYADSEGEAWPSVETLAAGAGFTVRGAWNILRKLDSLGVLTCVRKRRANGSSVRRLDRDRLRDLRLREESTPAEGRAPSEGTAGTSAKHEVPSATEPRSTEPSIHPQERESEHIHRQLCPPASSNREPAKPRPLRDAEDVRRLIHSMGIRGRNLAELSNALVGVPAEVIREELESVCRDRRVKSVPAVLFKRLQTLAELHRDRPELSENENDVVSKLASHRSRHASRAGDSKTGPLRLAE